jgi:hypothetical protein
VSEPTSEPPTPSGRKALEGLRAFWAATGQLESVLPGDSPGPPRSDPQSMGLECANDERGCTANVGFDAFAEAVEPTTDTAEALDRLRRAWKATLAREGKLHDPEEEGATGE